MFRFRSSCLSIALVLSSSVVRAAPPVEGVFSSPSLPGDYVLTHVSAWDGVPMLLVVQLTPSGWIPYWGQIKDDGSSVVAPIVSEDGFWFVGSISWGDDDSATLEVIQCTDGTDTSCALAPGDTATFHRIF